MPPLGGGGNRGGGAGDLASMAQGEGAKQGLARVFPMTRPAIAGHSLSCLRCAGQEGCTTRAELCLCWRGTRSEGAARLAIFLSSPSVRNHRRLLPDTSLWAPARLCQSLWVVSTQRPKRDKLKPLRESTDAFAGRLGPRPAPSSKPQQGCEGLRVAGRPGKGPSGALCKWQT